MSDIDISVTRKRTTVERELDKRKTSVHEFVSHLPKEDSLPDVSPYIPQTLSDAIFCGHLVTDLDSIAGSIGAAELYGGIPARASEVNSETAFALKLWGVEKPVPIEELLVTYPKAGVCLVDHQQTSQLNKAIDINRIVGVIDHHALQNATIVTDMPIYIDIRPWGSMSTIIGHTFVTLRRRPKKSTAGMLLCAILSDTLNLQGPTTTEWDRLLVAILAEIAEVTDLSDLVSQQFRAKSIELAGLTADALVNGDQKVFTFKTEKYEGSVGFAVIETTDDDVILSRTDELLISLSQDKESKGLSILYLAVVNIVKLKTTLLLCGNEERDLAIESFKNAKLITPPNDLDEPYSMDLGNLVSRKKDFIPAITKAIKDGWSNSRKGLVRRSTSDVFDV
eukprot:CAMPEP_0196762348 /NCGR_PEP_ID=MMETSP1095-20130614/1755_1 /TAXON_ID=96789 ORGANISM="Chromulina nebulosa, Strain UTEXLB2642" /NCGR_SAMPLE_ID=MMETSP1095 /ASSEMBLY_ACC=CAM_ASM_000446 /LENGTH=393 /DNA_ID=CAMNT_0042113015 /DNA_START=55 /DNA_END=1236 /DNA_ORIENTATION=+